jgi:protocatechuate 3,4-dioxygenase beta subunit
VPEDRRSTLLARGLPDNRAAWLFEIRLQGDAETVFFDL